jgi:hypothetical protein
MISCRLWIHFDWYSINYNNTYTAQLQHIINYNVNFKNITDKTENHLTYVVNYGKIIFLILKNVPY